MTFLTLLTVANGQNRHEDYYRRGGVFGRPYVREYPPSPGQNQIPQQHPDTSVAEFSQGDNVFLWDSFEDDIPQAGWSIDSSGDPAELTLSKHQKTEGDAALHIEPRFDQKKRVLIRRAGTINFEGLNSALIDVFSSDTGLRCALAYKDTGGGWHQSDTVKLEKGWNKNIHRTIDNISKQELGSPQHGSRMEAQEFYIVLQEGTSDNADVVVDNLRFQGMPTGDWKTRAPESLDVFQPTRSVGRHGKFEIGLQFKGSYGNLFNPEDTRVEAVFTSPDGDTHTIRGFLAGYADNDHFGSDWPIFLVRFAPPDIGRWTFHVQVTNPKGKTTGNKRWFYVSDSHNKGFTRIDPDSPRYFTFENGNFYYPIGQNVAWAQDYQKYMKRMEETGQNWIRIWMCPWHLPLETKPGRYHLDNARRLDGIIEEAKRRGIHIQLVLVYHGMLNGESWGKNPYNWDNDGPCYKESDFFTNQRAQELFKRRLDYIVARWSYATNIFAWELFNEVDLTRYNRFEDVLKWHREMSSYLKNIDPNNHLVTTSLSEKNEQPELWELPDIDFMPLHVYEKDIATFMLEKYSELQSFPKPWFVAEYARSTDMSRVQQDTDGHSLREALWASSMLPIAGNTMSWWWDSYIEPYGLNDLFSPLSQFNKNIDRRKQSYRVVNSSLLQNKGPEIGIHGMLNNVNCYLWLHPQHNDDNSGDNASPLITEDQNVVVSGMLAGEYDVMVMDIGAGKTIQKTIISLQNGQLNVPVPQCDDQVAIKIEYRGNPEPEVRMEQSNK